MAKKPAPMPPKGMMKAKGMPPKDMPMKGGHMPMHEEVHGKAPVKKKEK